MPQARVRAAAESLETLVDLGSAFLRRRRTQATGGSNSMASFLDLAAWTGRFSFVKAGVSDCSDVMVDGGSFLCAKC